MSKKIIVAGNWKMNKTYLEAKEFIAKLNQRPALNTETILAVPSLYADALYINNKNDNVKIVLQNCSEHEEGAYTGEVSAKMMASLNLKYCIVGHSERRNLYGDTDEVVAKKLNQLISKNIRPILCIGETLEQRENNETHAIIEKQLRHVCADMKGENPFYPYIAYEPVWAIGTGNTATKEQAQEIHSFIFNILKSKYGDARACEIPILYGGSCNEKNAEELFLQPNIWGGLIGAASLNIESFYHIMEIAERMNYAK